MRESESFKKLKLMLRDIKDKEEQSNYLLKPTEYSVICPTCGCDRLIYHNETKLYTCWNCFDNNLSFDDLLQYSKNPNEFKELHLLYKAKQFLLMIKEKYILNESGKNNISETDDIILSFLLDLLESKTEKSVNSSNISRYYINDGIPTLRV